MKPDNYFIALEYINTRLCVADLAAQLAEEAAELAQAALKIHRIYEGENPTPLSEKEAYQMLFEEIGDVLCCADAFMFPCHEQAQTVVRRKAQRKADRWVERLRGKLYGGGSGDGEV